MRHRAEWERMLQFLGMKDDHSGKTSTLDARSGVRTGDTINSL